MFRFIFGTWIGRLLMFLAAVSAAAWGVRRFLGLDQSESDDWTPPPEEAPEDTGAGSTDVDASLLEILACPEDKQPIVKMDDKIVCTHCGKRYPVRDGIPVMLIDEAEEGAVPSGEEVAAARAAVQAEAAASAANGEAAEAGADAGGSGQAAEGAEKQAG